MTGPLHVTALQICATLMTMQVDPQHVHYELSAAKFSWDHPKGEQHSEHLSHTLAHMHVLLPTQHTQ
jgi:hypothetical protein